jgi:hypothetical protein
MVIDRQWFALQQADGIWNPDFAGTPSGRLEFFSLHAEGFWNQTDN